MDGYSPALKLLKTHLVTLAPGEIADMGKLAALVAGCWHQFEGGCAQGMNASKLARIEAVRWEPPILSFTIERHSAMALGSTRADFEGLGERVHMSRSPYRAAARQCAGRPPNLG